MQLDFNLFRGRALILAIWAGLLVAPSLRAQVGIGLSPMRLELRMGPGVQQSGALTVSNDSAGRLRIRAELLDFYIDPSATPQFGRKFPQEAEFSCQQWLSVNPMEWEQDAGSASQVRYTVRVPQGVPERSYHCAVGFTTLPTAAQAKGIGLRFSVRAVTALYVVIGNPPIQGGVKDVRLERVTDPKQPGWRAAVLLENKGWVVFRPAGELAVVNEQGQAVESYSFGSVPVLPRREQRFLVPLKAINDQGKYTLRVRVDIGTGEIQEGTAIVVARQPNP
jgi:hypothetical protein